MNQLLAEHGIQNLGGQGKTYLEIEYYDLNGVYNEAVFAVEENNTLKVVAIYWPNKYEVVFWHEKGKGFDAKHIRFPEGVNNFIDFRMPATLGGNSIKGLIVRGSSK